VVKLDFLQSLWIRHHVLFHMVWCVTTYDDHIVAEGGPPPFFLFYARWNAWLSSSFFFQFQSLIFNLSFCSYFFYRSFFFSIYSFNYNFSYIYFFHFSPYSFDSFFLAFLLKFFWFSISSFNQSCFIFYYLTLILLICFFY